MALTMKNTTMETPINTGMIWKILRPTYSASAWTSVRRGAPAALPYFPPEIGDRVERLAAGRVGVEALHRFLEAYRRLDVGDGDPRGVLVHDLLRLVVGLLALVLVDARLALQEQLVDLGVLVVGDVLRVRRGGGRAVEQHVQEVVGVAVVPRPPEQAHRMCPLAGLLQVRAPLVGHELGVDPDLLEVLLHDLRDALGVGHVGARYRHVPQLGLEVRRRRRP